MANAPLRVAIAGLGPIGKKVAEALDQGIDGLSLAAVSAQNPEKHHNWLGTLKALPAILPIEKLSDVADIAIECAPAKLLRSIVAPFVEKGKTAIVLSAGALLENEDLIEVAKKKRRTDRGAHRRTDWPRRGDGGRRRGEIHSVRMVTRKPVQGPRGCAVSGREQYQYRRHQGAVEDFRRHRAGGRQGLSRQPERRGGAVAGRHRPGPHPARNLGGPRR